jgi:hypothetical protein
MFKLVTTIFRNIADHFERADQQRKEAYLNESSDIFELECRMRELAQRRA